MVVLGIETSCDETGAALVRIGADGRPELLAQALHSQVELHAAYGGVVPELASRDHIRRAVPLVRQALAEAGLGPDENVAMGAVDAVAYTRGPGLAGALLVGAGLAVSLAAALDRPVLGIHHLEGHLLSPILSADPPRFPFVALLVSGGHTQLLRVDGVGRYALLGDSVDDAAGEAFDKSAKLLGLGYPGGPALAALAERGDAARHALPRPLLHSGTLDFSFSGLKTAVRQAAGRLDPADPLATRDLAASVQAAIVDVLVAKSLAALEGTGLERLVVAGGVGANRSLRDRLDRAVAARGARVHYPELALCTDNGAMIALAGALRLAAGERPAATDLGGGFDVRPRWPLAELSSA